MSWGQFGSDVAGLAVPGLIGAAAALGVQRVANRANSANSRANREASKRADLREAVYAFLEAVQEAEAYADPANGVRSSDARNTALHKMWFRKRALEVIVDDELDAAAEKLTTTMRDVLFDSLPEGRDMWHHLDGPRTELLRAAHRALYSED